MFRTNPWRRFPIFIGNTLENFSSLFKKVKKTDEVKVDISELVKEDKPMHLQDSESKDHAMLSNPRTPPPKLFNP